MKTAMPTSDAQRRRSSSRRSRAENRADIIAATTELVRTRSYANLSVGEVMDAAGIGRTLFYRYFDDLPDLLAKASASAVEELFAAEVELKDSYSYNPAKAIRFAIEAAVTVYSKHGPLLRALSEAATVDVRIAAGQRAFYARFDELVAALLRELPEAKELADVEETAHALNILNTGYLLDAFGHEQRTEPEVAVQTLTEIWLGVIKGR